MFPHHEFHTHIGNFGRSLPLTIKFVKFHWTWHIFVWSRSFHISLSSLSNNTNQVFKMWIINVMNNKAASYLAMGQDMEAIELLRETFALLSDECNSIMGESEEEIQSPKHSVDPHGTSLTSLFNTSSVVGNHSESSFVYNNGFVLTHKGGDHFNHDHDITIMSATVIYNTALAYHRMALSAPESPCNGGWIYKATTFYQKAIEIFLLEIKKTGGLDHDAAYTIAVASYNNLGQINFDLLSDHDTARRCFESVSYLMECSLCGMESQEGSPFRQEDFEGILSNMFFVDVLTASVAAAA